MKQAPDAQARLNKWPPRGEGFVYFRVLCGNLYTPGNFCPVELGHARMIERRKGSDPNDPTSYQTPHFAPVIPGGGGIDHLGIGGLAPEFSLVAPEEAYSHDMQGGTSEGLWIVTDKLGYRLVKETGHFEILKPHRFGLTGAHAARRRMTSARAVALEERIDPFGQYGFSAEYAVLGDVPTLPAVIRCSRCSTLNHVRWPNDDDVRSATRV